MKRCEQWKTGLITSGDETLLYAALQSAQQYENSYPVQHTFLSQTQKYYDIGEESLYVHVGCWRETARVPAYTHHFQLMFVIHPSCNVIRSVRFSLWHNQTILNEKSPSITLIPPACTQNSASADSPLSDDFFLFSETVWLCNRGKSTGCSIIH